MAFDKINKDVFKMGHEIKLVLLDQPKINVIKEPKLVKI